MELEFATNGSLDDAFYETEGDLDVAGLENERCGICMDGIIDRGVLDCCEHWFCFTCIDNWATITNLCPLCQNEFQLITCVPVYDTIGSGKVEDDALSRDDDWCIQGTNNTLSFPSYYIDENAVICLDGDGCKIRNKVATSADDSILDTSIACDSCDIWYHAFCVDFDPEGTSENSWLCPRCIDDVPPQNSDGISIQMRKNQCSPETSSREHSVEASHSGKVSVSVADDGETAMVVSMIEGKQWAEEPSETSLPAQDINQSIQSVSKKSNAEPYVDAEENLLALSLSHEAHSCVPCDVSLNEFETTSVEAVSEPHVSNSGLFSGLLSDKPNFESNLPETESNIDLHLGLSVGFSSPAAKTNGIAPKDLKSELPEPNNLFKDFSLSGFSVDKSILDASEDAGESSSVKRKSTSSREHALATGHAQADNAVSIDDVVADPPSKKAKFEEESPQTSLNNEDRIPISESSKECSQSPTGLEDKVESIKSRDEMVAKFPQTSLNNENRMSIPGSSNGCSQFPTGLENEVERIKTRDEMVAKFPAKKAKVDGKSQQTRLKREVRKSLPVGKQDHVQASSASKDNTPGDVPDQEEKTPVSSSVVRGTQQRLSGRTPRSKPTDKPLKEKENGSGLRVKKIMRRSAENESSKLVENLREEIREAVRNKTTTDLTKGNLFDPKLLLAFRSAVTGRRPEHEPVQKLNPSIVRAKKSLLQKGKIRENLTKKIYGNSNGRRKRAWDRDWEVEFWKHRCKRASRPEKVETLMSVLGLLRKGSESSEINNDPGEESANPILSRLYLADTSVFPRNDNIKPLSALTGTAIDLQKKDHNVKENVSKPVNENRSFQSSLQISKDEASCKKVYPSGPSTSVASVSKVDEQSPKETTGTSDVKHDKRKWALEVLARKNSTVRKSTTEGNKAEDSIMAKGNFSLLSQLPPDMKPVLAPSRHNKVPLPVRQAQLYRITEHLLRKAEVPIMCRTAETELAVADAVNIEMDIINKSNSKLVYINLCSQVVSQQHITNNKKPDTVVEPNSSQAALVHGESIPKESSSSDRHSCQPVVVHAPKESSYDLSTEAALKLAGLESDSDDEKKGPENIFEIDANVELDIYGDFEYDLENEEDIIGGGTVPEMISTKPPPQTTQELDSKLKLVFSTLTIPKTDTEADMAVKAIIDEAKESVGHESEALQEEEICEELYGPDKEPPFSDTFPVACDSSAAGENSTNSSNVANKEKKSNTTTKTKPHLDIIHSVSKKVETYIKEHIRPLCKSGVINVEQYRWAVERTTTKIMKYHSKDTNANFLIKEGEKVKKLAEQYVEAAQKKDDVSSR